MVSDSVRFILCHIPQWAFFFVFLVVNEQNLKDLGCTGFFEVDGNT